MTPSYTVPPEDSPYSEAPENTTILDAVKLSGKTADGLSVGLIQSLTANEYAKTDDGEGNRGKIDVEPMTNYHDSPDTKRL